jgi:hypothetical protein
VQEWHPQLVPEFYVVLSLAGLILLLRDQGARPFLGACLFFGGLVLQLYTGVYWAVFFVFCLTLGLLFSLLFFEFRTRLWDRLRANALTIGTAALLSLALAAPLGIHSVRTINEVGVRDYEGVRVLLSGWTSWLYHGGTSPLYGWLDEFLKSFQNPAFWEEVNGIGLISSTIVIAGFVAGRKRPVVLLLALVSAAAILVTLRTYDGASLWRYVHAIFPGAKGLRAVGRIGLFLYLPFAIAAAHWIQGRTTRVALVLTALLVIEQFVNIPTYDKRDFRRQIQEIASLLPGQGCEAFLLSPPRAYGSAALVHSVAIWTALESGVPTVNASSGAEAPGWSGFADTRVDDASDLARLRDTLAHWRAINGGRPRSLCWVRTDPRTGKPRVSLE